MEKLYQTLVMLFGFINAQTLIWTVEETFCSYDKSSKHTVESRNTQETVKSRNTLEIKRIWILQGHTQVFRIYHSRRKHEYSFQLRRYAKKLAEITMYFGLTIFYWISQVQWLFEQIILIILHLWTLFTGMSIKDKLSKWCQKSFLNLQ